MSPTKDPVQFFCERSWRRNAIEVFVCHTYEDGTQYGGQPLAMKKIEENEHISQPTMSLTMTAAQQLMDELWRCGIRPTEGTGSAGSLAATERHLHDMQRIAFKLLHDEQFVADQARERGAGIQLAP